MADSSKIKTPRAQPVDLSKLPLSLPKVEIDYTKCRVPMWCKKCLQSCARLVFTVHATRMEKFREIDRREPGNYEVLAARRDKCTMCGKCVEVCPEGAITITYGDTVLRGNKKFDTIEAARKTDYYMFQTPKPYSYELSEEMLDQLHKEFDPARVVAAFATSIPNKKSSELDSIARKVFGEYGKAWMQKAHQLGEEYSDRTYEALKEIIDSTGELFFPLVPQRFIEIAYLSTQEFLNLPIIENYPHRLVYQVPNCATFKLIKEQCGTDVARLMPCKHACLSGAETLLRDLGLEATVNMDAATAKDGYCQFAITNI